MTTRNEGDNPELAALRQRAERAIAVHRDKSLELRIYTARAKKSGAIPLSEFLNILTSDQCKAVSEAISKDRSRKEILKADLEFYEAYKSLLALAKQEILDGTLIVRQLNTLAPVNNLPAIRDWCTSNDTLKGVFELSPHPRIVVMLSESMAWLERHRISVPDRLQDKKGYEPQPMPWVARGVELAAEIQKRHPKLTQMQVGERIHKQFLKDGNVFGRGGDVPSVTTIVRNVFGRSGTKK